MRESDLDAVRAAGLDDRAIVDANQVVSYFNYVNRVVDGLGVELEAGSSLAPWHVPPYPLADDAAATGVVPLSALPVLDLTQSRELDRIMVDELGITLERMMENAGRQLAQLARQRLGMSVGGRRVAILAGSGGNGGGGLVAARHLANAGAVVSLHLTAGPADLTPVPLAQYEILMRMGVPASVPEPPADADLLVDAIVGYSLAGAPRGEAARLIAATHGRPVLSLDVPSGLEVGTGVVHEPAVQAGATLALAALKRGVETPAGRLVAGELFVGDISVPPAVFARLGLSASPRFDTVGLLRVSP